MDIKSNIEGKRIIIINIGDENPIKNEAIPVVQIFIIIPSFLLNIHNPNVPATAIISVIIIIKLYILNCIFRLLKLRYIP